MAKLIVVDGKLGMVNGRLVTDENGAPCCCEPGDDCPPILGDCTCEPEWIVDHGGIDSVGPCTGESYTVEFCPECCGVGYIAIVSMFAEGGGVRDWTNCAGNSTSDIAFSVPESSFVFTTKEEEQGGVEFDGYEVSGGGLLIHNDCTGALFDFITPQPLGVHVRCPPPILATTGRVHVGNNTAFAIFGPELMLIRALTTPYWDIDPPFSLSRIMPIANYMATAASMGTGSFQVEGLVCAVDAFGIHTGSNSTAIIDSPGSRIITISQSGEGVDGSQSGPHWFDTYSMNAACQIATIPIGYCDGLGVGVPIPLKPRATSFAQALEQMAQTADEVAALRGVPARRARMDVPRTKRAPSFEPVSCRRCGGPTTPGPCGACLNCGQSKGGCG